MKVEQDILEKVIFIISDTLHIPVDNLTAETLIKEELGADSLSIVTLMIALDTEFDTEFKMEEIPIANVSIGWVSDFVSRTLSQDSRTLDQD